MKYTRPFSVIIFLSILFVASCTIEKRHYRKGYHVEFMNKNPKHETTLAGLRKHRSSNQGVKATNKSEIIEHSTTETTLVSPTDIKINLPKKNLQAELSPKNKKTKYRPQKKIASYDNNFLNKEERSDFKEENGNNTGLWFLMFLTSILACSTVIFKSPFVKNISKWGRENKWGARIVIGFLHLFVDAIGLLMGKVLFDSGMEISSNVSYGLFAALLGLSFFHPKRTRGVVPDSRTYYRTKLNHLALNIIGFLLFVGLGNKEALNKNGATSVIYGTQNVFLLDNEIQQSNAENDASYTSELKKKTARKRKKLYKKKSKYSKNPWAIVGTVFLIIAFVLSLIALAALTCTLICSAQYVLAAVVAFGATALVIWGFVAAVIAINK